MSNLRLFSLAVFAVTLGISGGATSRRVVSLDEIFQTAEQNSATLRASEAAREEARRDISVARSQRLPDINASLGVSYIGDGFTTKRDYSDYQRAPIPHLGTDLGIAVQQPVYAGGAISAGIEMARRKEEAAALGERLTRSSLRMRLTGYYLDIYKQYNLRRVAESNLAAARKVLEEMEARYRQGTVLRNDITRYELLVSDYELSLTRINNTLAILNNDLVTTAGLESGTVIIPDSTLLARALPREEEQWWQERADANSPQTALAQKAVDMSLTAEKLAGADRLPQVSLRAGWQMNGPILVEVPPIDRNLSYWFVGVGVSYNLSSLFKSNKTLSKSRAATIKSRCDLDMARENLAMDIKADYLRYLEACDELSTRRKAVELATRNYNTTATRFSADMALLTDMLDAAASRLDAEQQLVGAQINIIYFYYKLLSTSGTI